MLADERQRGGQPQALEGGTEKSKRAERGPKPYVDCDRLDVEPAVFCAGEPHPLRHDERASEEAQQGPANGADAEKEQNVAGHDGKKFGCNGILNQLVNDFFLL